MSKSAAKICSAILTALIFAARGICEELTSSVHNSSDGSELSPRSYYFYDRNYPRDIHRNSYYPSSDHREDGRGVTSKPYTVISSTSYSVQPGSNGGSAVYVNTLPIPISFGKNPATTGRPAEYDRNRNQAPFSGRYHDRYAQQNSRDRITSGCSGMGCSNDDLNKSYYSILNGRYDYPNRSPTNLGSNRRQGDAVELDGTLTQHGSLPFVVSAFSPQESQYDFPRRRVTRTSTTSPAGWVKLSPRPSQKTYDPFFAKGDEEAKDADNPANPEKTSKFENRIGVELDPDSFAARWGYTKGSLGGTRLPEWLEKLNKNHGHGNSYDINYRNPSPTRDEDPKNWVKLEPIPVAGVSISKWVPKGTSNSDMPTTGNNVRGKPHAWWDEPINAIRKRPNYQGTQNSMSMGWSSSGNDYDSVYTRRPNKPGNAWQDVIYPDTPGSATASWEANSDIIKGGQRYPSSLGSSSSMPAGWKSDTRRGPVASWTAPGSNNRHYQRRPANNYPDRHSSDDDPRWVLVSNSRLSTPSNSNLDHRYRPHVDQWRLDVPDRQASFDQEQDRLEHDHEPNEGIEYFRTRLAKDFKLVADLPQRNPQDEAFERLNSTLYNLEPVLTFDDYGEGRSLRNSTISTTTADTTTTETLDPQPEPSVTQEIVVKPQRRKSFLSSLIGDSRQASAEPTSAVNETKLVARKGNSMKPILAAVGAGMIPATMAAVIPMMMGRKKRSIFGAKKPTPGQNLKSIVENLALVSLGLQQAPQVREKVSGS